MGSMRILFIDNEVTSLFISRGDKADMLTAKLAVKLNRIRQVRAVTECELNLADRGTMLADKMADATRVAACQSLLPSSWLPVAAAQGQKAQLPAIPLSRVLLAEVPPPPRPRKHRACSSPIAGSQQLADDTPLQQASYIAGWA